MTTRQRVPPPPQPVPYPPPPPIKPRQGPCPYLCSLIPTDVPEPEKTQAVLHPGKDVFVLKVAKVGLNRERRCRMELELVTPKFPTKPEPYRVDTRETQCEPECDCCCTKLRRKKK
ncbi:uncharacterized protein LOC126379867 [Pectinophora gossypiella]|uniref:uncharacterized protein LOC126379867 n=1 Tax=Pectinophora gossypiella TaxID=13191 RepID=UPI00214DFA20|nr:uncharacterized protein LOC126379867 [Pectinophora gossypiella]